MEASIPSEMYSTSEDSSFNEFLTRSEILVASLPSTPKTAWLMTKERLGQSVSELRQMAELTVFA